MRQPYNFYKGFAQGNEIIPRDGWQREEYENNGRRFFEPVAPAPRPERDANGNLIELLPAVGAKAVEAEVEIVPAETVLA